MEGPAAAEVVGVAEEEAEVGVNRSSYASKYFLLSLSILLGNQFVCFS